MCWSVGGRWQTGQRKCWLGDRCFPGLVWDGWGIGATVETAAPHRNLWRNVLFMCVINWMAPRNIFTDAIRMHREHNVAGQTNECVKNGILFTLFMRLYRSQCIRSAETEGIELAQRWKCIQDNFLLRNKPLSGWTRNLLWPAIKIRVHEEKWARMTGFFQTEAN